MKKDVKIMLVSEYHPDSIVSTTPMARDAIEGVLEYIKYEKPDVIIVDDPNSNILYPELFSEGCFLYDPVENFMDKQFDIAEEFFSNLKKSSPSSKIYVNLTDASWYNIRRLTKHRALELVTMNKSDLKEYRKKISEVDKEIERLRESKDENKNDLMRLYAKKGGLTKKLVDMEEELLLKMPRRESEDYVKIREKTTNDYLDELKKRSKLPVEPYLMELEKNGNSITYWHTGDLISQSPKKNRFSHLLRELNKSYIEGVIPPDFILFSGHDGLTVSHPFRHDEKDRYSLVASGMVMEDQKIVKDIAEGKIRGDITQGKQGRPESIRRYYKSYPSPGVVVTGRKDGCLFFNVYSMNHLSRVGSKEINPEDMEYEEIPFLADLHIGKGASRVDVMERALKRIRAKKPNLMVNVNETLQGRNYKTMAVETPRKRLRELKEDIENMDDVDELKNYILREHLNKNEPVLDNQVDDFYYLMLEPILDILVRTPYKVGYITTESTHIDHTVGEYGISEVNTQTEPFVVIEDALNFLEKNKLIKIKNDRIKELRKKIKAFNDSGCGWGTLNMKIGENEYEISAEHKPGSSTPKSNIPLLGIERREVMKDLCDIKFEGHLHIGYASVIPLHHQPNSISVNLKGMTFNEYDSYGKLGGWPPATVGYIELGVPKNKNGKGSYKIKFVTSEVL